MKPSDPDVSLSIDFFITNLFLIGIRLIHFLFYLMYILVSCIVQEMYPFMWTVEFIGRKLFIIFTGSVVYYIFFPNIGNFSQNVLDQSS